MMSSFKARAQSQDGGLAFSPVDPFVCIMMNGPPSGFSRVLFYGEKRQMCGTGEEKTGRESLPAFVSLF